MPACAYIKHTKEAARGLVLAHPKPGAPCWGPRGVGRVTGRVYVATLLCVGARSPSAEGGRFNTAIFILLPQLRRARPDQRWKKSKQVAFVGAWGGLGKTFINRIARFALRIHPEHCDIQGDVIPGLFGDRARQCNAIRIILRAPKKRRTNSKNPGLWGLPFQSLFLGRPAS